RECKIGITPFDCPRDNVTCWHQPAYVSPEREPHCSPHRAAGDGDTMPLLQWTSGGCRPTPAPPVIRVAGASAAGSVVKAASVRSGVPRGGGGRCSPPNGALRDQAS